MKRTVLSLAAIAICLMAAITFVAARVIDDDEGESERSIALKDVPQLAREAILREAGGHEILEVESVMLAGQTVYEADWKERDLEIEVRVSRTGDLLKKSTDSLDETDDSDGDDEGMDSQQGSGR